MPKRLLLGVCVLVAVALLAGAALGDTPRAFTLGVTNGVVAAELRPGQQACQAPISVPADGEFDRVKLSLGTYHRPGPAVDVDVLATGSGAPLGHGRLAAGYPDIAEAPSHAIGVGRVAAEQEISVCVTNRGPGKVAVYGNADAAHRPSTATSGGKPLKTDLNLAFERKPRSLAALAPAVVDRAALFRAGWVGPWTYVLLMGVALLAVPALLLRALRAVETAPGPARAAVPAPPRPVVLRRRAADPRLPLAVFGALAIVAGAVLLYVGRGTTFYYDDWSFLLTRRGGGLDSFLEGHNGHFSLLPVLVYKALWGTVGLDGYWAFRVVVVLLHLCAATLVFLLVRPRLGAWPAAAAGVVLAFLGVAWQDLLWPFQIGYVGSVAAGLGAWLALDRRTQRGDVVAAACLFAALACSGLGIPLAAGAIVELAWRREWRRLAVVAGAPVALYALWSLGYGDSQLRRGSLTQAPQWFADVAASAVGGLLGRGPDWGRPLTLILLGALFWRLAGPRPLSPRLLGLGAAGVTFWALTAASRADLEQADVSRYTYLGGVIVLLVIVELLRDPPPIRGRVLALAGLILVVGVAQNLNALSGGGRFLRATSDSVKAELAAMELQRERAPAGYAPDGRLMPQVSAGPYLKLIDDVGDSPAYTPAELARASEGARGAADRVLRELGAAPLAQERGARPARRAPAPRVEASAGGRAAPRGPCVAFRPAGAGATLDLTVPASGLLIRAGREPVAVSPRRFSGQFAEQPAGAVPARATYVLRPAPDGAPAVPWHTRLSGAGPLRACTL